MIYIIQVSKVPVRVSLYFFAQLSNGAYFKTIAWQWYLSYWLHCSKVITPVSNGHMV